MADTPSPGSSTTREDVVGGEITLKMEPGKAPKLSRTASQKIVSRLPSLYLDLPDATEEAKATFSVLQECVYANKHIGTTDPALECDCGEEWGKPTPQLAHRQNERRANGVRRCLNSSQPCLWRGFGLHQPCNQDGVWP